MNKNIYIITGITGFIGSNITKRLLESSGYQSKSIKIIGFVRDENKARNMFRQYDTSNMSIVIGFLEDKDLVQKIGCLADQDADIYLIHCAATTKSSIMISNPVETADGIIMGTKNILELACRLPIKSMIYLSSMEIYGNICDTGNLITENTLGDIELFNSRSCYPLGKRLAEHYCFNYYKEYGVPVKIVRLAQVFGAGILPDEKRIFAQFANAVLENRDIVLHTSGQSIGNYCETGDAVEAIFTLLDKGENGEAYNVVNEANTMRIREMAELVAEKIADNKIKVVCDIQENNPYGYAADTGLRLSAQKLGKLGWKPTKNMVEMYCEMIEWMKKQKM